MSDALCLTRVRIHDGTRMLMDSLDLTVAPGECVTVMGPEGSGKSALLAWIAGTLDPAFRARGRVSIGGDEIATLPAEQRHIGIQFADDLLFPHLSVAGNVAFALPPRVRGRAARHAAAERVLREAGLEGLGDRDPAALSTGQCVRVALLRTLAAEPRALLLDDPFGRLDPQNRVELRRHTFEQAALRGLPVLLATRDVADARVAGGPVVVLAGGTVPAAAPPMAPASERVEDAQPRVRRA